MNDATSKRLETYVRNMANVENASTRVRPCRSLKWPHQAVDKAERIPIIVVIHICRRAVADWTSGSLIHCAGERRTGLTVFSLSRL